MEMWSSIVFEGAELQISLKDGAVTALANTDQFVGYKKGKGTYFCPAGE